MSIRDFVWPLMVALPLLAASCARPEASDSDAPPSEVSQELRSVPPAPRTLNEKAVPTGARAALAQELRAVHAAADRAGTLEEKTHVAEELLELFQQTKAETSPHVVSVRQDLAARAALLLIEVSPEKAKEAVLEGLAVSDVPSVVRANLFLALADAEEALLHQEAAKKALLQALSINEQLFESEMKSP